MGTTATTTRDATICVSQSGGLLGTGPRQSATSGASTSQDWPRHARVVMGGPMGDALPWAGGEEQSTECTHTIINANMDCLYTGCVHRVSIAVRQSFLMIKVVKCLE